MNDKQKRFCDEYLIDLNATQAAIRAGYSEKTAYSVGQRLLKHVEVQKRIHKLKDKRSVRTQITADRVLEEYAKIAFSDIRRLYDGDGTLKKVTELDDDTAACVIGLDVQEGALDVKKYKLADKKGALDSLGKHLGMFTDKVELSGGVEITMDDRREIIDKRLEELRKEHED